MLVEDGKVLEDKYCSGGCRAGVDCVCEIRVDEIVFNWILGLLVLLLLVAPVDLFVVGGATLLWLPAVCDFLMEEMITPHTTMTINSNTMPPIVPPIAPPKTIIQLFQVYQK